MTIEAVQGNEGMNEHDQLVWAVGRIQELERKLNAAQAFVSLWGHTLIMEGRVTHNQVRTAMGIQGGGYMRTVAWRR